MNRVTQVRDGENQVDYTYDREGRLLRAQSTLTEFTEQFSLDAKGNRLADNHTQYSLNAADQIKTAENQSFEYDALGNMTRNASGVCYDYSALNRLKSVDGGHADRRAEYFYDAFGRRVGKQVNGVVTRFIWAGSQLLHEIQWSTRNKEAPAQVTDYLFFPQTPVLLGLRHNQQTYWAAFGHRYEVLSLTASDGQLVWQAEYNAFGRAHITKGPERHQPFRLAGQYFDNESGLHYNQARYYDPGLGRYLSLDPLFLESGSHNFYIYGNGDPINHLDPDGEFLIIGTILIGAVIGAAISGGVEYFRQTHAKEQFDGFKIAKAALLGAAIGAVGAGAGAAVEGAVAVTNLARLAGVGFLSGAASSTAEQCVEASLTGHAVDPLAMTQQALVDGAIGAVTSVATLGIMRFFPKKLTRAASSASAPMRIERQVHMIEETAGAASKPSQKAAAASARSNGSSNLACVGDPVNPITGEVILTQTDFTLPSRIPLTWTREYGSVCQAKP
jgi:RHS repeat-associated protein